MALGKERDARPGRRDRDSARVHGGGALVEEEREGPMGTGMEYTKELGIRVKREETVRCQGITETLVPAREEAVAWGGGRMGVVLEEGGKGGWC